MKKMIAMIDKRSQGMSRRAAMGAVMLAMFMALPSWGPGSRNGTGMAQDVVPDLASCSGSLPYPCARTDVNIQQESPLPFNVGPEGYTNFPANTVFTDPDFGERILRVTDNNTLISDGCFNQPSVSNSNLSNGGAALDNVFSSDSKWFRVADNNGNRWLFSFNPATMQASCVQVPSTASNALPFGNGQFGRSITDPGIYFGIPMGSNWAPEVQSYNVATGQYATVVDFRQCAGLSWLSSLPHSALAWTPTPQLSWNDNRVAVSFGPTQNEGWLTAVYQRSTGQCGWVDTRTGQIGGNFWPNQTQMSGAFPLNFNVNGGPAVPLATATTGGSLTPGDQYAIQYSLVYETVANGKGETAASPIQYITLSAAQNAVALPSPAASANDAVPWSHYNIYACDNTASPGCTPTLQPAANLGCSMANPTLEVQPVVVGSTSYTYIEEAEGQTCNTWDIETINNGTAPANNTLTPGSVAGAYFYRVIRGPWTAGTATAVHGIYPGDLWYGSSAAGASVTDTGIGDSSAGGANVTDSGQTILLSAVGTMSCNASYTWMPTPGPPYTCNNNSQLIAISAGGPPAPTVSTLGIFQHEMLLSLSGSWAQFSQEALLGSNVFWNVGRSTSLWCNVSGNLENPPNSYATCDGHSSWGSAGPIFSGGTNTDPGDNYDNSWRPSPGVRSEPANHATCSTGPTNVICASIAKFPAVDPNGFEGIDQHTSWNNNHGLDLFTPYLVSTEMSGGQSFTTPTYIGRGWAREIFAVNPATAVVYRFAHHRATGTAYYNETACNVAPTCASALGHQGIAIMSVDGKWGMFTSDMDWLLGCRPLVSCTYNSNGQVTSGESRADVFIVELK
ncbi:MAG TPA: hypothetical protein VKM93_27590 [Terriglobia bacterium]|nr:hypothetical protein [Terriglobia bacterium]